MQVINLLGARRTYPHRYAHSAPLLSYTAILSKIFAYSAKIYQSKVKKQAFLLCLRFMLFPHNTREWINYLENKAVLRQHESIRLDLASKIYRPFLRASCTIAESIQLHIIHLDIIIKEFSNKILTSLLNEEKIELVALKGKNENSSYIISLFRDAKFSKEGELSISICANASEAPLATVSFIFGYDQNSRKTVIVGGLQGPTPGICSAEENKQNIINATKDLNGLMPKRAVMEALCAVARNMKIASAHAPSNINHVARRLSDDKQRIYSNYEDFWIELGGAQAAHGDYVIATHLPKRSLEEVPAKKRKSWLVRSKHLETIGSVTFPE